VDPTKFSGLARPVEPRYRTNRAVSIISGTALLLGTVYLLLSGEGWWSSLTTAGHLAVAIFLTWALARELDPDYSLSAFIGLPLMLIPFWFDQLPHLIPMVAVLMILRTVSRITGQSAQWLDSMLLVGLSIYLAWEREYILSFGIGLALLLDGWLTHPLKRHRYLASLSLLATVGIMLFRGSTWELQPITAMHVVPLANLLFALVISLDYSKPQSTVDNHQEPLSAQRIQWAQRLALTLMLLAAFLVSLQTVWYYSPFWAALTGVNLHFLFRKIRHLN